LIQLQIGRHMPLPHKKDGDIVDLQRQPYPGDVCQVSAEDANETSFQTACAVMSVFSRYDQVLLTGHPEFSRGWTNGMTSKMGIQSFPLDSNPTGVDEDFYNAQRAFMLGLVSGLVAQQRNYRTPFCVADSHNGKCELYDADGNLKKTEATE
jgi:hypothetical protein